MVQSVLVSLLLLVTLCLHTSVAVGSDSFTWADCGIQLTKDIHYISASISPTTIGGAGPLSINVQASVTTKIYNSATQLVVYKDGEQYLNVPIQDLCTIISSSTKSLSCPLNVGTVSFTYTFDSLPVLPVGYYDFYIKSGSIGCIQLSGRAGSLIGTNNFQTSSFVVTMAGTPTFFTTTASSRAKGDPITVSRGIFKGPLVASTDLGGTVDLSQYNWDVVGTVTSTPVTLGTTTSMLYGGNYTIYSPAETLMSGAFNWSYSYDLNTGIDSFSGTFDPYPRYYFSNNFTYPIVIGNLAPFTMTRQSDLTFVVSGSRKWCTAGVDRCNVCGGDGSTCGVAAQEPNGKLGDRAVAAIVIGVVGGVIGIIGVAVLARKIRSARRAPRYDDADLIDHPQKPDYGTMAIDDIMREGERATY